MRLDDRARLDVKVVRVDPEAKRYKSSDIPTIDLIRRDAARNVVAPDLEPTVRNDRARRLQLHASKELTPLLMGSVFGLRARGARLHHHPGLVSAERAG